MSFQFPLQTLLRFRQGAERQCELALQQSHLQVAAARRKVEDLDLGVRQIALDEAQRLETGLTGAEMRFEEARREILVNYRPALERELAAAEASLVKQGEAYRRARRDREVVETLREQQWKAYEEQEVRQQQRRLDEMFLLRRDFLKRRNSGS